MIKFFRKIRQKMLSENKFSKYLLYAIGEIVLVVIGILIALQINNWNEGNKNHQRESLILNEVLNSINKDLKYNEDLVDRLIERKQQGLDSLETYILGAETIQDSLFLHFYRKASQNVVLLFDNGPYEALKSSGLELITNDSLRSAINNVYAFELPTAANFSNNINDEFAPELNQIKPILFYLKRTQPTNQSKFLRRDLKDRDILNNQDFLLLYNLERIRLANYKFWLEKMKTSLLDLKTQIEKELNK
ncbi:DUF6090 family protein [Neolewinella persica]|uniref:DUF6090 family protein n=1 Tax=Neolewinella persica TaxID=70998 RepID=UPI000366C4E5|nr:DUF6090 family protein [Neolewinella persica]